MSCISSNFSSFFLNSLNDPSEFTKYLSNGELKFSSFEDFQVFGAGGAQQAVTPQQQQQYLTHQQLQVNGGGGGGNVYYNNGNGNSNSSNGSANGNGNGTAAGGQSGADMYNNAAVAPMDTGNYHSTSTPACAAIGSTSTTSQQQQQQQQSSQQSPHAGHHPHTHPHTHIAHPPAHASHPQHFGVHTPTQAPPPPNATAAFHHNNHHLAATQHHHNLPASPSPSSSSYATSRWPTAAAVGTPGQSSALHSGHQPGSGPHMTGAQHFDGSFEFLKYLRHSSDYNGDAADPATANSNSNSSNTPSTPTSANQHHHSQQQSASSLIDLDSSTSHKSRSSRKAAALLSSVSRVPNHHNNNNSSNFDATSLDVFDHDSKHTIFDLHHMTNSSNSNESSLELSSSGLVPFSNSHLNASNSNTSSEGAAGGHADFSMLGGASNSASSAPKPLASFVIKDNFDVHPSHKVEEGIFQHMNKLPPKKKENLKQLGVRFTGQMTLADKSIVVENFIKFCQEYDIKDHRPFLSLNQSGLNKPEQIKFARYLGQGLPTFTLFCIYSNFKNLFCTKRTEIYTKDGYNLPYILDKTKRFLSNTTADLKNMVHQQSNDGLDFSSSASTPPNTLLMTSSGLTNVNSDLPLTSKCIMPKVLENLTIQENFDVHETHRVEDGVCTHITRLPPKKQEILKQFGIQNNQSVTYYEKYIIIENFIKFCNEYKITDHRPFLDFHESGLPKSAQLQFVRYLGQGLPNLTLNKIYLSFKDILGLSRIEKITLDGYNLDMILKKKKKNLYNRMHAAVHRESAEAAARQGRLDLEDETIEQK